MRDDQLYAENRRYLKEFLLMLRRPIPEREEWYKTNNSWEFADDIRSFGRALLESSNCPRVLRPKLIRIVVLAERMLTASREAGGYVSWRQSEWSEMEKWVDGVITYLGDE